MSDISQLDLIKLALEAGKITRLEQIFPTIVKNTFAREMKWNASKVNEKIEKARLLDMETVRRMHKAFNLTPQQVFLLFYNQYLYNEGEDIYAAERLK